MKHAPCVVWNRVVGPQRLPGRGEQAWRRRHRHRNVAGREAEATLVPNMHRHRGKLALLLLEQLLLEPLQRHVRAGGVLTLPEQAGGVLYLLGLDVRSPLLRSFWNTKFLRDVLQPGPRSVVCRVAPFYSL